MSLALVSRKAALLAPWNKNELWRRARAVPSLDLRFADNKSLVDATTGQNLVTFTRASSGTYVDSTGTIKTATTNEARFDHNPTTGESLGLLVEEQRTNLLVRSEEFDNASWGKTDSTISANAATALTGENTADKIIGNAVTGYPRISQTISVVSGNKYQLSVFAKQQEWGYLSLQAGGTLWQSQGTSSGVRFNLTTGTVSAAYNGQSTANASITNYGNGWYRCSVVWDCNATTASGVISILIGNLDSTSQPTGNGTSGLLLWGSQLEAGAFPTSYIPTTTAAATRSADVASISGSNFSSWYRQDEGTVFAETQLARQNTLVGAAICGIETGVTNAETIYMHYRGSSVTAFSVFDNSVLQADFSPYGSVVPANTLVRQAGAIKLNDMVGIGGGFGQTTDTVCTVPTPDRMLIGFSSAATNYLSGTIRRLTYWPQRLSNTSLQQITQ